VKYNQSHIKDLLKTIQKKTVLTAEQRKALPIIMQDALSLYSHRKQSIALSPLLEEVENLGSNLKKAAISLKHIIDDIEFSSFVIQPSLMEDPAISSKHIEIFLRWMQRMEKACKTFPNTFSSGKKEGKRTERQTLFIGDLIQIWYSFTGPGYFFTMNKIDRKKERKLIINFVDDALSILPVNEIPERTVKRVDEILREHDFSKTSITRGIR
jgi:uncharacterized small protein (DUF1192 family)